MIEASKFPETIRNFKGTEFGLREKHSFAENGTEATKLIALLDKHQWNRSLVAKELNIGRTTLWRKLKNMIWIITNFNNCFL